MARDVSAIPEAPPRAADVVGRERMLERLVDAYGKGVLQLAYFYLKDRGLAEDIFQEVFTRVYLQWDRFRGDSSPRTWIYRITVNLCRDKLRTPAWRRMLLLGGEFLGVDPEAGLDVATVALAQVDREALLQTVMELPLEYREVVLLYYYEGMDTKAVALALTLNEGTVRSRLHRGRTRLKALLVEGGLDHDYVG